MYCNWQNIHHTPPCQRHSLNWTGYITVGYQFPSKRKWGLGEIFCNFTTRDYFYHFPIEVSIHTTNPTGGTDDLKIKLLLAAQTTRGKQCQCIQWTVKIRWNTPARESLTAEIPVIPVILFGKFKIVVFFVSFFFFFWWYDSQQSNIFLIQWHNFIFLIAYFKDIRYHYREFTRVTICNPAHVLWTSAAHTECPVLNLGILHKGTKLRQE